MRYFSESILLLHLQVESVTQNLPDLVRIKEQNRLKFADSGKIEGANIYHRSGISTDKLTAALQQSNMRL